MYMYFFSVSWKYRCDSPGSTSEFVVDFFQPGLLSTSPWWMPKDSFLIFIVTGLGKDLCVLTTLHKTSQFFLVWPVHTPTKGSSWNDSLDIQNVEPKKLWRKQWYVPFTVFGHILLVFIVSYKFSPHLKGKIKPQFIEENVLNHISLCSIIALPIHFSAHYTVPSPPIIPLKCLLLQPTVAS